METHSRIGEILIIEEGTNKECALKFITENGEITQDPETGIYTVWDETYNSTVCTTSYPAIAEAALKLYREHYIITSANSRIARELP